jgi:hypothetical protein
MRGEDGVHARVGSRHTRPAATHIEGIAAVVQDDVIGGARGKRLQEVKGRQQQ